MSEHRNWVPVGMAEAAQLLGVSTARLRKLKADREDFPQPVRELAMGDVYDEADILAFDVTRDRGKGGRPRKAEPS